MKTFPVTPFGSSPPGFRRIASFGFVEAVDPTTISVYSDDEHVMFHQSRRYREAREVRGQTEIPARGLGWLLHTVAYDFLPSPDQGGLPAGKLSLSETIDGEVLWLARIGATGGEIPPGIMLSNHSRKDLVFNSEFERVQLFDTAIFGQGIWPLLCAEYDAWAARHGQPPLPPGTSAVKPHAYE